LRGCRARLLIVQHNESGRVLKMSQNGQSAVNVRFWKRDLFWLVVNHLTFVISGVRLALLDWLAARACKY
jgi:uncharacterized membrane protein YqhA